MPSSPLDDGVRQFRSKIFPELAEHFAELAGGQAPDVLFIGCADSRVDPSLITQTRPGELFVCRNAGNIVPPHGVPDGFAASVEYAVTVLRVGHIVVCGHSSCGVAKAALDPPPADALPAVADWIGHVTPGVDAVADVPEGERLDRLIEANAVQQLANLRTHPSVVAAEDEGRLTLHAWVYDIGSGEVRAAGDDGTFAALN